MNRLLISWDLLPICCAGLAVAEELQVQAVQGDQREDPRGFSAYCSLIAACLLLTLSAFFSHEKFGDIQSSE